MAGVISYGWGLCCEGEWSEDDPRCISIQIKLCTTEVAILLEQLLQSQQENPATAQLSFNISLTHVGALTPRCDLGECGPIPYDETVQNDVPESRNPVYDVATETAACGDDSECQTDGCGNECVHWTESGGFGTCDYRGELTNAFCGCVEVAALGLSRAAGPESRHQQGVAVGIRAIDVVVSVLAWASSTRSAPGAAPPRLANRALALPEEEVGCRARRLQARRTCLTARGPCS